MPVRQRRDSLQRTFLDESNGSDESVHSESDDDSESRPRSVVEDEADNEKEASLGYLLALTCGVGGLQVVWSVVLSNGTPYLISLGLSKSLTALVWMAAPLCGVFVQPIMGVLSDRSQSTWGRRRPFIVLGTLGAIISMLTLAWIENLTLLLTPYFMHQEGSLQKSLIIVFAVLLVYALNISIQPIQMGLRALIVENCPKHQQTQASAWATYSTSCGNIIGYICGSATIPEVLHMSDHITQFQSLCSIASMSLILTVIIGCFFIIEKDPKSMLRNRRRSKTSVKHFIRTIKSMPPKIQKVCQIQFFSWMAWFPFLYYSATYVGELYIAPIGPRDPSMGAQAQRLLRKESTHVGTLSSLLFAIVAFLSNIILSSLLQQTPRKALPSSVSQFHDPPFSVARAWMWAHFWFAISMFATIFVTFWAGGAVLVAYAGISWAMTLWAPFAIIGEEMAIASCEKNAEDQMGVIMSIHNVAISAPQVLAAILSSGLFWVAHLLEFQDSTGLVLRVGGFAALAAGYLTWKLED